MKLAFALIALLFLSFTTKAQLVLKDIFGRDLSGQTITLVDWEGYMANPAIQLTLQAPANASFPLTVTLSANGPRLYFNMPSTAGSSGPTKSITFNNSNPFSFYLSIFPDRGNGDETYTLTINSSQGQQSFPIYVVDQDKPNPTIDYNILVDFTKDKPAYNFFADSNRRNIVRQAAKDWGYFIQNMNFDPVPANNEWTFIWDDYFTGGNWALNAYPYTGYLLYAYSAAETQHRSGGAPSLNDFQRIAGDTIAIRRSGGYNVDPQGNYNTLGWDTTINDNTWYVATNGSDVPNDLYSIALHEMGHAFCFNPGYPVFDTYKNQGYINHPDVVAYQGTNVPIDASDHFSNRQSSTASFFVDRISKKGAFGSEYASLIPYGRWLITKLNLLCLKAIGYDIKQTSAFIQTSITTTSLPNGTPNQGYNTQIVATGGIPFYKFEVLNGSLPPGLSLNSFTGQLTGTPTQTGMYGFDVRVTDYDQQTSTKSFSIQIGQASTVYTFIGNGNWSNASNWQNNQIPPVPIPNGTEVIIDPVPGGQCTFIGNIVIQPGGKLTVKAGKILNVNPQ